MYNAQPYNSFMYNSGGAILELMLAESVAADDDPTNTFTKFLAESQTYTDALTVSPAKQLFEVITFSDTTILQLFLTKQFVETIRVGAWLKIDRPEAKSDFTQI